MDYQDINEQVLEKLTQLEEKYNLTGQNLIDNLAGLLYNNYLKYWDYIKLDTLLSLQSTRTDFPDEMIFITYHQITELYFKLILWEIEQIAKQDEQKTIEPSFFKEKLKRIILYFEQLSYSFDIMVKGMDLEQFKKFRMALLPASGFQSAQFRMIEICMTDFINLLNHQSQQHFSEETSIEALMPYIYWKQGATEEKTGRETITSQYFQEKYGEHFLQLAKNYQQKNIWQIYQKNMASTDTNEEIKQLMRQLDYGMNVVWRMAHLKSAAKYLQKDNQTLEATGGTNWLKYLPPRMQKRIFFPALWSVEEKENWGRV